MKHIIKQLQIKNETQLAKSLKESLVLKKYGLKSLFIFSFDNGISNLMGRL